MKKPVMMATRGRPANSDSAARRRFPAACTANASAPRPTGRDTARSIAASGSVAAEPTPHGSRAAEPERDAEPTPHGSRAAEPEPDAEPTPHGSRAAGPNGSVTTGSGMPSAAH